MESVEALRTEALAHFKLSANKKTILIIGGSLGARTINESIHKHISQYKEAGVQLLWQTGKIYFPKAQNLNDETVKVFEFIYEMHLAYAVADIVISRAGALSIAELAHVKKPVILVPSPNVAEDHQTKNAMALVERQAAILIKDAEAREKLADEALALLNNEMKQVQLKNNISTFDMPNAADRIVDELLKVLNTN